MAKYAGRGIRKSLERGKDFTKGWLSPAERSSTMLIDSGRVILTGKPQTQSCQINPMSNGLVKTPAPRKEWRRLPIVRNTAMLPLGKRKAS